MKIIRQNFINKRGFTLAEVLITLGIIGVVAALTVPTLIAKQQKKEYVTKLKKAYTTINQALVQMSNDAGCPGDLNCSNIFSNTTTFGNTFATYFKTAKNCSITANSGCMPSVAYQNTNGGATTNLDSSASIYKFITSDGIAISLDLYNDGCDAHNVSSGKTGNLKQICGLLWIDINSPYEKPNQYGRDLFLFRISNGKGPLLYPAGGLDDAATGWWKNHGCNTGGDNWGAYCAARIIEENWEMNY